MGEYCTVRDVRLALAPLGEEDELATAASLSDFQIEDAIAEAEGIIDAYVGGRYTIEPVTVTEHPDPDNSLREETYDVAPKPLRGWTRSIAAYFAALTFRKNKDLPEDDPVRLRYDAVMKNLTDVRDGRMDLNLTVLEVGSGVEIFNPYDGRLFGLDDVGLGYGNQHVQRFEPLRKDVI